MVYNDFVWAFPIFMNEFMNFLDVAIEPLEILNKLVYKINRLHYFI